MFQPDSIIAGTKPLPVVITAFRVNDHDTVMEDIRLAHDQNYLTIQFSALDYATPSHTRYRYRLYPLEQEWNIVNDGSGKGSAHYMALQPGNYRFEVQASSPDGKWGETNITEIEIENMDNIDYTVDQMASDIAMSRANLYKKTQQMLGITPNEFLRNVRLKHAASLLEQTDMPVNQVSLTVGFQTARYFSQCFRQMFGVTPTEYRNGETSANI